VTKHAGCHRLQQLRHDRVSHVRQGGPQRRRRLLGQNSDEGDLDNQSPT